MNVGWVVVAGAIAASGDGAEISRSRGPRDGVVVLYPRLVPPTDDTVLATHASTFERTVADALRARLPGVTVDVRPAPERSCPRVGCRAVSVGLVLGHDAGGCVGWATVGPPGPVDVTLVPLAGGLDVTPGRMPFRSPPEDRVVVREFVPCSELADRLDLDALAAAITAAG